MSETHRPENTPIPSDRPIVLDNSNPLFAALPPERQTLFSQFDADRLTIHQQIDALVQAGRVPGTHGTSSNYLASILEHGLGAIMPVGALAQTRSTTEATTTDGMLGAYLFAKGLKGETLAIRREEVDPKGDALLRYTALSPAIPPEILRRQIERYFTLRAEAIGEAYAAAYPVLLVVVADSEEMQAMNPQVPSERKFVGIFEKDRIAMILVPEAKVEETQELIAQFDLQVEVRAIEPLELL